MDKKEALELAHWAVKQAGKAGAGDCAIQIAKNRSVEVEFRDRNLEILKESTQNGMSIDIYAGGRFSSHTTNDIRKEFLSGFIEEAVAMTKYLAEDSYRALPDPKYYEGRQDIDLQLFDENYDSYTADRRIKFSGEIEDGARSECQDIITCTTGCSDSKYEEIKVNSNGFEGYRRLTSFSAGAEVTIDDHKGGRPRGFDNKQVRYKKDMPAAAEYGKIAAKRAMERLGQAKIESGKYDMVVANYARPSLLWALYDPLTGTALYRKNSFLDGKLGEKIFSEKLTIIDDPFIKSGLGSRLYDNEGITAKKRVFIDKGVLRSYFISNYYARKLGVEPTSGGTTNILFEYGDKSFEDMVAMMKRGILVTGFIGGNSNSLTGDFSYGVVGHLIENGQTVKPINEMNVSGNLVELWNGVTEVGNDPYMYSTIQRPSFYFKDVQFSGI